MNSIQIDRSSDLVGTFGAVTFAGATPPNCSVYLPVEAPTYVQFDILPVTPVRLQSFEVD